MDLKVNLTKEQLTAINDAAITALQKEVAALERKLATRDKKIASLQKGMNISKEIRSDIRSLAEQLVE